MPAPLAIDHPVASDPEAVTDGDWFADRPRRRFRLRPGWAVRRRGRVFLRTPTALSTADDTEAAAEMVWWGVAWPTLDPKTRDKLMRDARQRNRGRRP